VSHIQTIQKENK